MKRQRDATAKANARNAGPAKRHRTSDGETPGAWARLRIQEELVRERETKERLVWYLHELLVEMEQLLAQEKTVVPRGRERPESHNERKLRTYKQFISGELNRNAAQLTPIIATPNPVEPIATTTTTTSSLHQLEPVVPSSSSFSLHESHHGISLVGQGLLLDVKAYAGDVTDEDPADLIPEVSAPEEPDLELLHSLQLSESSPAHPALFVKAEPKPIALISELDFLAGIHDHDDDISIFLNLPDGDDGDEECLQEKEPTLLESSHAICAAAASFEAESEGSGYTGSPSLDFASKGSESWDEVELDKARAMLVVKDESGNPNLQQSEADGKSTLSSSSSSGTVEQQQRRCTAEAMLLAMEGDASAYPDWVSIDDSSLVDNLFVIH